MRFRRICRVSSQQVHDLTPRFAPQGSRGPSSPASSVLSGRYDSLPLVPPRFVAFAWRYRGGTLAIGFRRRQATNACGPGRIDHPGAPYPRGFVRKRQGLPRSWGTPIVPMPCSATPAGPITLGHSRCIGTAPVQTTTKAPAGMSLEAQSHSLGTRCLRFAGWITPPPRKTRFRLPAKLYRTGLMPAGFQRKVSDR